MKKVNSSRHAHHSAIKRLLCSLNISLKTTVQLLIFLLYLRSYLHSYLLLKISNEISRAFGETVLQAGIIRASIRITTMPVIHQYRFLPSAMQQLWLENHGPVIDILAVLRLITPFMTDNLYFYVIAIREMEFSDQTY